MRVLLSWSGGKDSALALEALRCRDDLEVAALLTTTADERVAMHGIPTAIVEAQARAAGLPLWQVALPSPCPNAVYERIMTEVCERARGEGIDAVAFGDLFLEDIRRYREESLAKAGLPAIFPLWTDAAATPALAREASRTLRTRIVCIDPRVMPETALGADYDEAFLTALPEGVDPMGERGEFHTLVVEAPAFDHPIAVEVGHPFRERDGFLFATVAAKTP